MPSYRSVKSTQAHTELAFVGIQDPSKQVIPCELLFHSQQWQPQLLAHYLAAPVKQTFHNQKIQLFLCVHQTL